eukprot:354321-Chlamydomonas_euryale.AAC.7
MSPAPPLAVIYYNWERGNIVQEESRCTLCCKTDVVVWLLSLPQPYAMNTQYIPFKVIHTPHSCPCRYLCQGPILCACVAPSSPVLACSQPGSLLECWQPCAPASGAASCCRCCSRMLDHSALTGPMGFRTGVGGRGVLFGTAGSAAPSCPAVKIGRFKSARARVRRWAPV